MKKKPTPQTDLKTSRAMTTVKIAPILSVLLLAACASAPKPAVPDGSSRVQINDPARLIQLQQQNASETVANNDRAYFQAEITALKNQVEALNRVVRATLILPAGILTPPAEKPAAQASPTKAAPLTAPVAAPAGIPVSEAPKRTIEKTADGVIVRQFYQFGKFQFTPEPELASALRTVAKTDATINVSGFTDSSVADSNNNYVASARALSARRWLIENGVESNRIQSKFHGAANFLKDNSTKAGRAMNRRVELEIKGGDNSALVPTQEKANKS